MLAFGVYLAWISAASLITFFVFGFDKRQAGFHRRRISERTLHLWALAGGWPGALLGQQVFRHKTRKLRFQIIFWTVVGLHVMALVGVVWLINSGP